MNIFDKIKNGMTSNEISDAENNYGPYDSDENTEEQYVDEQDVVGMTGSSLQLKVVKPASYGEAKQIARHLLDGKTVVLNLECTQKEDARHLIDFLHGVVYSIDGNFKNVAANTFIITPNNVDVTGDSAAAAVENNAEEN